MLAIARKRILKVFMFRNVINKFHIGIVCFSPPLIVKCSNKLKIVSVESLNNLGDFFCVFPSRNIFLREMVTIKIRKN